jgi:hypothetical protein
MTHVNVDAAASFPNFDAATESNNAADTSIEIMACSPVGIQSELTRAFGLLLSQAAPDDHRGILVTRHTLTTFTVALSSEVPRRTTYERDLSQRTAATPAILEDAHHVRVPA